jgi:hypothetical protein
MPRAIDPRSGPTTSTRNAATALPFVGCGCCLTLPNQCPGGILPAVINYKEQYHQQQHGPRELTNVNDPFKKPTLMRLWRHFNTMGTKLVESMSQSHVQFGKGEASLCLIQTGSHVTPMDVDVVGEVAGDIPLKLYSCADKLCRAKA